MHLLQSSLSPAPNLPDQLYLKILNPQFQRKVPMATDGQTTLNIVLEDEEKLSTDTFFGSFYNAYWQAYAPVKDLYLQVAYRGTGYLRVFEDTQEGVFLIHSTPLNSKKNKIYEARLETLLERNILGQDDFSKSRIFVELEAAQSLSIDRINFMSKTTAPQQTPSLSIGLCTFNQETYFAKTLSRVTRLASVTDEIKDIYVVNQGRAFSNPDIQSLVKHDKTTLVEQRNLGGCGGFTRSLIESLQKENTTHHLMMDDDIILDERLIMRAIRFLSFAQKDIALGGAMLDSFRPSIMHEAGAFLMPDNTIEPYCHNVDVGDSAQLYHFNSPVETDYNAWWFCILPTTQCREVDLPAPVFIRGDDFEYGQRLAAHGVPTVTLPGIAVWHEPFYAKPAGWQTYYDTRNRMIFGATYADDVSQFSLTRLVGLLATPCLEHDYRAAWLRLKAVEDYLAGPDKLFERDPEETHNEVMALARTHAPEVLTDQGLKKRETTPGQAFPSTLPKIAAAYLWSLLATGLMPAKKQTTTPILMDVDVTPRSVARRSYIATNGPRSFHLRFTPDRSQLWTLMKSIRDVAEQYRTHGDAAAAAWAKGIPPYRGEQYWQNLLNLPEQKAPSEQQSNKE